MNRFVKSGMVIIAALGLLFSVTLPSLANTASTTSSTTSSASTETSLEETRKLLEKGLSIYEIDKEVARLTEKEKETRTQIHETEVQIGEQEQKVKEKRKHAAQVLRAYYAGDRDNVWLSLLTVHSFSDALVVYEYLSMAAKSDQRKLKSYEKSYQSLKKLHSVLVDTEEALGQIKAEFLKQRDRLVVLQQEVKSKIEESPEGQQLQQQIEATTKEWKEKGLPVFESYFEALSKAMANFPMTDTDYLSLDSLTTYTFQITDQQLNDFLREENSMFDSFSFTFADGSILAEGTQNDIKAVIKGRYVIQKEPNLLRFHIDELIFNDIPLPDTTRKAMEEQYDLTFEPSKVSEMFVAEKVAIDGNKLKVKIKLSLN